MKEQRRVLQVVIPIMLASLVVSAVLEFSTPIFTFIFMHSSFLQSIFIGIFSSSFLLVITALISYFRQKKAAVNQYWLAIAGFSHKITEFAVLHLQEYANQAKTDEECISLTICHLKELGYGIAPEITAIHDKYAEVNLTHSKISFTVKKDNAVYERIEKSFLLAGQVNQKITDIFKVAANMFPQADSRVISDFSKKDSEPALLEKEVEQLARQLSIVNDQEATSNQP